MARARGRAGKTSRPTRNGRRRWQLWLSDEDFADVKAIMAAHGHGNQAEAIRFAIRQQSRRDREGG